MEEDSPKLGKEAVVSNNPLIYFNHGATSFPKPPSVVNSVINTFPNTIGSNRGVIARFTVDDCRKQCANFLDVDKRTIIFTSGCTMALNLAILGFPLNDGDHIVYCSVCHHATMRPCRIREKQSGGKIKAYMLPCPGGVWDMEAFETYL